MSANTRTTILASVVVVLLLALGAWWYFGFTLDFMRFFAAVPGYLGPPDRSVIVSCSPATQTVQIGATARLTTTANFPNATWYAPGGNSASEELLAFSVSYAVAGTKKVTVESPRFGAPAYVDSVPCTVVVVAPPAQ